MSGGSGREEPTGSRSVEVRSGQGIQIGDGNTQIIHNYGSGTDEAGNRRPADSSWVVAISGGERSRVLGAGVVIGTRRVLASADVCRSRIDENGDLADSLWVHFTRTGASRGAGSREHSRRVIAAQLPEGDYGLAVLLLEDAVPPGVRVARLRRPVPDDLDGLDWWAFGFPDGQPHGNSAYGKVGAALGEGFVRLDARSRCRADAGFAGSGLWSPDYEAVVGILGGPSGDDVLAVTLYEADLRFGAQPLGGAEAWAAGHAGEAAMSSWGWALRDDPEYGVHWRPKSRGTDVVGDGGYRFRGRRAALTAITGWLGRDRSDRRALVVTGSPGAGKSAVLGRVVTTADPGISSVLHDDSAVRAAEGSVACAVHAKGKTALEVGREIARAASARLPDRPLELAPAVRAVLSAQDAGRFNVVIDALDEAASQEEARLVVGQLVLPLLQQCADMGAQVVIGTRRRDDHGSLIDEFGDAKVVIDLDAREYFQLEDLEAYALATLQQTGDERPGSPYAAENVARPLAARIAQLSDGNFLVASLTALAHGLYDEQPADPGQLSYTADVRTALNGLLDRIGGADGIPAAKLLTALAYAEAPGLPFELWIGAVEALYGIRPQEWQLDEFTQSAAANFIIETSQDSEPVFRLFHQALNDTLLGERARRAVRDQRALTSSFLVHGRQAGWESAPPYLLRSLPHHAQAAGMLDELLADDAYLLHADLRRLAPQATAARTDAGKQRSRLLQLTPYAAATADPKERRALFSVTETLEKLGDSFRTDPGPAPYRARWSTVSTHAERVDQEGHTGGVTVVRPLVLDGRTLLVSGGEDEIVRVWDPVTCRQQLTLEGHAGQVNDLHAFPGDDGRTLLASAGADAAVRVWDPDPARARQLRVLEGHVGTVVTVCSFLAEDRQILLASGGADGTVRIWDPSTGRQQQVLPGPAGTVAAVSSYTSGGRTLLVSVGMDGAIRLWDPASGEPRKILERRDEDQDEGSGVYTSVCPFTGAGGRTMLASNSAAGVWVWDPESGEYHALSGTVGRWVGRICAFAAADGGRTLLAYGTDWATVGICDPATGETQRSMETHPDGVYSVCAFTGEDGQKLLASSGCENTIRIWDPLSGEPRGALRGHSGLPWGLSAFTAVDQRVLLATAGDLEPVQVRDPATGEKQADLVGASGGAWSVCAFPAEDGHSLLASGGDELQLWDTATWQLQRALDGGGGRVCPVCAVTSQGRTLLASASASPGTGVRVWDPATGALLRTVGEHTTYTWDMCMFASVSGQMFLAAIGMDDGLVPVWDPATGQQLPALAEAHGDTWSLCGFTDDDGRALLATAHGDGRIRLWDPATGTLHRTLTGHPTGIITVRPFTRDGRTLLASGGDDAEYRIWDPATGQALLTIPVHITPSVVADVDGTLVVGLSAGLLAIELNL